jgi:phage gp45-like
MDNYLAERGWTRALNTIGRATLSMGDDSGPFQLHQLYSHLNEIRDGSQGDAARMQRFQSPGFSSMPLPGAGAVVVYQGGHRGFGTVIAVEDGRVRPTGLQPGEFQLYAVSGAGGDGAGGTTRPILKGSVDGNGHLSGIQIFVGDSNTTNVTITGSATVNINAPKVNVSHGGALSPVVTVAGPSPVLSADG